MAKLDKISPCVRTAEEVGRKPRMPPQNRMIKGSAGVIHTIVNTSLGRSTNRWFAERYNVNNAWNFNGNNGNLNNNNVNNGNQVGAVTNLPEQIITQENGFIGSRTVRKSV